MDRRSFIQAASTLALIGCRDLVDASSPSKTGAAVSVAKHFVGQKSTVPPLTAAGAEIPATSVAMSPGAYVFSGKGYDCTAPGLYLFWDGASATIHARLVYGNDLYAFLSGISWHHAHGVADEHLTGQLLANAGMTHKWRLRCGYLSDFMLWWLPQYGYKCRKVYFVTKEPLNGVDDGHIAFEVWDGGKWKMWDITNGLYFTRDGLHLSGEEIVTAGVRNCQRVEIDGDEKRGSELAGSFDMASYMDLAYRTAEERDAWFARIFQSWHL